VEDKSGIRNCLVQFIYYSKLTTTRKLCKLPILDITDLAVQSLALKEGINLQLRFAVAYASSTPAPAQDMTTPMEVLVAVAMVVNARKKATSNLQI